MTVTLDPTLDTAADRPDPATPPRSRTQLARELLDRAHTRGDLVTVEVPSMAICTHRVETALVCRPGSSAAEHVLTVDDDPTVPGSYVPATTRGVIAARHAAGLALADLGHGVDTSAEIAIRLEALSVRAVCGNIVGCAIAVHLLRQLNLNYAVNGPSVQPAAVTRDLAYRLSEERMGAGRFSRLVARQMPSPMITFISRFDNGAFAPLHHGCDISCSAVSPS